MKSLLLLTINPNSGAKINNFQHENLLLIEKGGSFLFLKYIELREDDPKSPAHSFDIFSTDHTNYNNAGIILNKNIVVVDFDTLSVAAEKVFETYPTLKVHTSRGFHLWYRRPATEQISTPIRNYTDKTTVAGIKADYKTGNKAQAIVKQGGEFRKMDNPHYLDDLNALPELPLLLYPSKLKHDLLGMKDGQGRNSGMYSHLLTSLEQYSIDNETLGTLASYINHFVFAQALPEEELKNTVTSVLEKKPAPQKARIDPTDMISTSEALVEKLDIHYYNHKLFFRESNNKYITDNNKLLREIDKLVRLKPSQHKQLMQLFEIKSVLAEEGDYPISLNDGHIIDDGEIIEIDYGFTPFHLDVRYEEQAYDEHVDAFLDFFTADRPDLRRVVEEVLGHILMTKSFPHKVFFFQGASGENGKSTFLDMVKNFTNGMYAGVALDKFDDDTSVHTLIGKLVNIGDDINASYLDKSANFKTLAAGDFITVRPIYSAPLTLENKATLIFTCNEMPTFKDKSGGIGRRVTVIPCDAKVKKVDRDIKAKLSSDNARSYLLHLALEGAERIRSNGGKLSVSETIESKTKDYFISSDTVLQFLDEHSVLNVQTKNAYLQYSMFCEERGLNAVGSTEFGRRLKQAGFKSMQRWIDGQNRRVYVQD